MTTSPKSRYEISLLKRMWVPTTISIFLLIKPWRIMLLSCIDALPKSKAILISNGFNNIFNVSACCLAKASVGAINAPCSPLI